MLTTRLPTRWIGLQLPRRRLPLGLLQIPLHASRAARGIRLAFPSRASRVRISKMSLLDLPRVPEVEAMDDAGEVEAYASASAQAYLDKIDDTFVEHALRLVNKRPRGRALDIGTGP